MSPVAHTGTYSTVPQGISNNADATGILVLISISKKLQKTPRAAYMTVNLKPTFDPDQYFLQPPLIGPKGTIEASKRRSHKSEVDLGDPLNFPK